MEKRTSLIAISLQCGANLLNSTASEASSETAQTVYEDWTNSCDSNGKKDC